MMAISEAEEAVLQVGCYTLQLERLAEQERLQHQAVLSLGKSSPSPA